MTRFVVNDFFKKMFKNNWFGDFPVKAGFPAPQYFVLAAGREKIARTFKVKRYTLFIKADHIYDRTTD